MFIKKAVFMSYDGANYHGFQLQRGIETVQGVIEECIKTPGGCVDRGVIHSYTGRTDAGVSSLWQTVVLLVDKSFSFTDFNECISHRKGLVIWGIREEVPPEFHASRSAIFRDYVYIDDDKNFRCGDYDTLTTFANLIVAARDFGFLYKDWKTPPYGVDRMRVYFIRIKKLGRHVILHIRGEGFVWNFVRRLADFLRKFDCKMSLKEYREKWIPGAAEPDRLFMVGAKYSIVPRILIMADEIIDKTFKCSRAKLSLSITLREFLSRDRQVYSPYSLL